MKFTTLSIIAGSEACNARCPYCVSKMTPLQGVPLEEPEVNWRNFRLAARLAKQSDVTTVMITGKGEPTLFPQQISQYLDALKPYEFPLIELQTNGILLQEKPEVYDQFLREWYEKDLGIISVSIVHYAPERNREVYTPHKEGYVDLPGLISKLHEMRYSVRLSCIMMSGFIDSAEELERLVSFAYDHGVEQLTVRPVNAPDKSRNDAVKEWTLEHMLRDDQLEDIASYLEREGYELSRLPHGGIVYDVHGQNVCLTNSLTLDAHQEEYRQLIFFPDGHVRYDWQYKGAILL